ncbi:hypothetical protein GO496_11675 [Acidovorax citrulli]|nr:hypothetical protein [Paracidovorax citrulli]
MKLDLEKAKSALILLGTSFFKDEENTLKDRFNLNHDLIQEGLERLSELTKTTAETFHRRPRIARFP